MLLPLDDRELLLLFLQQLDQLPLVVLRVVRIKGLLLPDLVLLLDWLLLERVGSLDDYPAIGVDVTFGSGSTCLIREVADFFDAWRLMTAHQHTIIVLIARLHIILLFIADLDRSSDVDALERRALILRRSCEES